MRLVLSGDLWSQAEGLEIMSSSFPLQNRRIVVTRSAEQADDLCAKLEALGATPIRFPVIQFDPLPAPE